MLLSSIVNTSNQIKCFSLSNRKCEIQPTFNLHPNEYIQEFHYYPFSVKLGRCVGSCKMLNDLSNKVYVPNKTKDFNLSVFNMIIGIIESKLLTKRISCECKCKFDETKYDSTQCWNNDKCRCECKKINVCEKDCLESCYM